MTVEATGTSQAVLSDVVGNGGSRFKKSGFQRLTRRDPKTDHICYSEACCEVVERHISGMVIAAPEFSHIVPTRLGWFLAIQRAVATKLRCHDLRQIEMSLGWEQDSRLS